VKTASRDWPRSVAILTIGAAVPLLLVGILIVLEYWGAFPRNAFNAVPWRLTVTLAVIPGLIPISQLRWRPEWRIVAGLLYFLAMFAIIPLYAVVFACTFTGDCI